MAEEIHLVRNRPPNSDSITPLKRSGTFDETGPSGAPSAGPVKDSLDPKLAQSTTEISNGAGETSNGIKTKVTEIAKTILDKMGFVGDINFSQEETNGKQFATLSIVSLTDSGFLIGKNGANLEAMEHILRAILSKASDLPRINFTLDVNDYRKIKTRQLAKVAKEVADRVAITARAEALEPMTSYERRLVHTELASYNNIATESIGEEPKRRIVIKPLF